MHRLGALVVTFVAGAAIGAVAQSGRLRHSNPPALSTPTGYTQVVAQEGGRIVFIAGQVAVDTSGAIVGKGDFKAQVKQVFENLKAAVGAAGGTMADVAKITIYATDTSQLPALRDVRQQYFTASPPASTFVKVVSLARPEYLIEIEAIALVE